MNFSNIYLTDDMALPVREARRKLPALRKKTMDCQICQLDVWVSKSVPPLLCIQRHINALVEKYMSERIADNFLRNKMISSEDMPIRE